MRVISAKFIFILATISHVQATARPFKAGPNCPWKVSVAAGSQDKAYAAHPELYQHYFAEPGSVHGKSHWTSADGNYAIWFDGRFKNWKIGKAYTR